MQVSKQPVLQVDDEEKKQDVMDSYDNSTTPTTMDHHHQHHDDKTTTSIITSTRTIITSTTSGSAVGMAHRLARPNILELQPYRCARDDYDHGILLDANENSFGPTSLPTPCVATHDNYLTLERYPDPYQLELKQAYIQYRNAKQPQPQEQPQPQHNNHTKDLPQLQLQPSDVFCGVGSDEAIDLLLRIFCTPGQDNILITPPTYGMYKVCAKVNDVHVISVPLTPEFDLRIPEMLNAVTPHTKLLFICSPGNPTARAIPIQDIEAIASSSKYHGLVVVDEAYVDFCTRVPSALSLIRQFSNVVVLQTLSKAFGLAGIRCGFCVGAPDIIQLMNNVKAPYNISSLTSEVALNAFQSIPVLEQNVTSILQQKQQVMEQLQQLDFVTKVFPSDSNFILFRVQDYALEIYKHMADHGVVTRYRGHEMYCDNCIRVTIGKPEENQLFLQRLVETYQLIHHQQQQGKEEEE